MGILHKKSGQVAPFLILVAAVLLVAITATMRIGEVALSRIRMANVADSALVSSSVNLCRRLNQIRQISLGEGGMLITYVRLQVFLLSRGVWSSKWRPFATGEFINDMLTSRRLYRGAKRLARDAVKDLRISLWDRAWGGALVDEPKPFIDLPGNHADEADSRDEVNRDEKDKVAYINYNKWFKRDMYFTEKLREFKKGEPENWYKNDLLSYSWNKNKSENSEFLYGKLIAGEPDTSVDPDTGERNYGSYLKIALENIPESISPRPKRMIMLYFYASPSGVLPGIIPHPYAWIKRIDINYPPNADEKSFGLDLERPLYSFVQFPFFRPPQEEEEDREEDQGRLYHRNRIKIEGSIWRGYEPKMVR